jgi:hypothetical protein
MRWGLKKSEMALVPTFDYIEAVKNMLRKRTSKKRGGWTQNDDGRIHLYLCTEDPLAVKHFVLFKPRHWNVYSDQYYVVSLPNQMKI